MYNSGGCVILQKVEFGLSAHQYLAVLDHFWVFAQNFVWRDFTVLYLQVSNIYKAYKLITFSKLALSSNDTTERILPSNLSMKQPDPEQTEQAISLSCQKI